MNIRQRAGSQNQGPIGRLSEGRDVTLDLARIEQAEHARLHSERRYVRLDYCELRDPGGSRGTPNDSHARHSWRDLLEQVRPFPTQAEFEKHEASNVTARPRQSIYEA